jgi:hypothetical protein
MDTFLQEIKGFVPQYDRTCGSSRCSNQAAREQRLGKTAQRESRSWQAKV